MWVLCLPQPPLAKFIHMHFLFFPRSLRRLQVHILVSTLPLRSGPDSVSTMESELFPCFLWLHLLSSPSETLYKINVILPHIYHRDFWAWSASQVAIFCPPSSRSWLYLFILPNILFGHTLQILICLPVVLQFSSSSIVYQSQPTDITTNFSLFPFVFFLFRS